jgi:hypothetical protein
VRLGSLAQRAPRIQAVDRDVSAISRATITRKADRAAIERIGAREGWRTHHFWRGPRGTRLFELYEFWVENRVMLEIVTEDMLPPYVQVANGRAQTALLAARQTARAT